MTRVLITGGAGFIGSHLTEAYLNAGDEVVVIDDCSTGSKENLARALEIFPSKLTFHQVSILNNTALEALVREVDVVIHLAAAVGVSFILDNPLASFHTNLQGTEQVLSLCNKYQRRVLIASTSEVYGKRNDAPLKEDDDCILGSSQKLRWSYAASKLMDEFYALAYFRDHQLPVTIARFFNTVGPRQSDRYGMVLPRFVRQALRHEPITVYGDGTQTRTFTAVQEVVTCIRALVATSASIGAVVNIGGKEEVTIHELAQRIKERTQSISSIQCIPYEQAYSKDFEDMQRRVPCTKKLHALIGTSPTKTLNEILDEVISFERLRL